MGELPTCYHCSSYLPTDGGPCEICGGDDSVPTPRDYSEPVEFEPSRPTSLTDELSTRDKWFLEKLGEAEQVYDLTDWERTFIKDMRAQANLSLETLALGGKFFQPTARQYNKVSEIATRARMRMERRTCR